MKKLLLSVVVLLLFVAGCGDKETTPVTSDPQPGMIELPIDMRTALVDLAISDETTTDDIEMAFALDNPPDFLIDTSYDVYSVTFLWGQYLNSNGTDWSGRLWMNAVGEIKLLHTISFEIGFEDGEDTMIPTDNPTTLAWESFTQNDFDGITTLVFVKRGIEYFAQPTLRFETEPFTNEIDFVTLENYAEFFPLDSFRAVAVVAHKLRRVICPGGVISGEWIRETNDLNSGHFSAEWMDRNSEPVGILTGNFWTNDNGQGEFSGYLSHHILTVVLAEVKGHWYFDDPRMCPMCGSDHGVFKGKVTYLDGSDAVGIMIGEFGYGLEDMAKVLPMKGRWKMQCVDVASDHLPTDN